MSGGLNDVYQYKAYSLLFYVGGFLYAVGHLIYDGSVDMQISRCQCRVSDTQVTVNACRPLVSN